MSAASLADYWVDELDRSVGRLLNWPLMGACGCQRCVLLRTAAAEPQNTMMIRSWSN